MQAFKEKDLYLIDNLLKSTTVLTDLNEMQPGIAHF